VTYSDAQIKELCQTIASVVREFRRDGQEARFFRLAEFGIMQGYSPEELADYLRRFYNASKGKSLEIPASTAKAVPIEGNNGCKMAPAVRQLVDRK